ncbi:hypothetical protein [Pacificibacter marinus]|uniref:hypothetical protein n=1 Tax=Pacificibacter marinus TaxID=658057 RepID=UPI001C06E69F|nr:hypothetical protein [Pacificibacter marinus]MBU2867993.1 hypothetical protein [Pacificibacter marinus]
MKTAFTIFFGFLLSFCLTLYGPFGMAQAGGGAVFSIEICADGGAKTVLFDANGNPVEPAANCPECLTCCQAIGSLVPENDTVSPSFTTVEMLLRQLCAPNPIPSKRHMLPAPRGPPAVQVYMLIQAGLILFDHPEFGQMTRSDGRFPFKDAFA